MEVPSDSDDSAFLFLAKRKKLLDDKSIIKKTRLSEFNDRLTSKDGISINDEKPELPVANVTNNCNIVSEDCWKDNNEIAIENDCTSFTKFCIEKKSLEEGKVMSSKLANYFSCPLCSKNFTSENNHVAHMKQCAKKSNMTAKELLEALELQKKKLKEKIGLDTPNLPKKHRKASFQHDLESSDDLALAMALSKSLQHVANDTNYKENQITVSASNMQGANTTTLEDFGFTAHSKISFGNVKKKRKKSTKVILLHRTNEERERLMTEKAAIILLNKDDDMNLCKTKESLRVHHSKQVEKCRSKVSRLWELGGTEELIDWYVEELKNIIAVKSTISENADVNETESYEGDNIDNYVRELNLPKATIFEDWKKLINNKHLSDLTVNTKDGKTLYLHSIVVYARWPRMLDFHLKTVFGEFSQATALNLLQYLYCGTLDGLSLSEVDSLLKLAQLIDYGELVNVLESLREKLKNYDVKKNAKKSNAYEVSYRSVNKTSSSLAPECEVKFVTSKLHVNDQNEIIRSLSDVNISLEEMNESMKNIEGRSSGIVEEDVIIVEENVKGVPQKENEKTMKLELPENSVPACSAGEKDYSQTANSRTLNVGDLESDIFEEVEKQMRHGNTGMNLGSVSCRGNELVSVLSSSLERCKAENNSGQLNEEEPKADQDYEIPYFDPYEHFSSEFPEPESPVSKYGVAQSQSLIFGEVSPLKSDKYHNSTTTFRFSTTEKDPLVPEYSSTPYDKISRLSSSNCNSKKPNRLKRVSSCSKIRKLSMKITARAKLRRRESIRNKHSSDIKSDLDEGDSEGLAGNLPGSLRDELDVSTESASNKNLLQGNNSSFLEVTPIIPGEEYSDAVSPLPDYSKMGASTIKKHLTKYGLKKSLSKNKAKKILKHIYDELHPILNTKNGKIVKYKQSEKCKTSSKTSRIKAKEKEKLKTVGRKSMVTKKNERRIRMIRGKCKPLEGKNRDAMCEISQSRIEDEMSESEMRAGEESTISTDTLDGIPKDNSQGICFEVNEPLSQSNYSNAVDASEAIFDFIHSNPDIHRQILMYEPIWLEELQKKLIENYNKRFKLTDLMDCLDVECISFRCQSQRRANKRH